MAAYSSTARRMLPHHRNLSSLRNTQQHHARCELDSHADTCALGSNFIPLSFTGRAYDVTPYNADSYEPERDVPIVSGATAYTCHSSGQTYILVVNEGLWYGPKLQDTLLNPNQLRFAGVTAAYNPFNTAELISIEHNKLTISLSIRGTTIFLETSTPTQTELDSAMPPYPLDLRHRMESADRAPCSRKARGGGRIMRLRAWPSSNFICLLSQRDGRSEYRTAIHQINSS